MEPVNIHLPQELFESAEMRHYEGQAPLALLQAGPDTYTFAEPVVWSADITNTGGALLVMGQARANAVTQCARCLDDVSYQLEGDIEGYFLIGGEEAEKTPPREIRLAEMRRNDYLRRYGYEA